MKYIQGEKAAGNEICLRKPSSTASLPSQKNTLSPRKVMAHALLTQIWII